ncbi:trifunctional purine biosynthetic protein adenosine-3 [Nephila pilipes]|uniref:Trifunctional purine biosynthetic protein adenosine-3 n=1 Tax=Nephila pilipes TaxID=299642 RepID=A0A8X6N7H5_NEPPI|nr:trifunctional purine biosynthetic protein adenosine-3 [Nephila pilipes]
MSLVPCVIYSIRMAEFVLVIGSGAREHALAWKLSMSPLVKHIYVSPGNAGTHTTGKFSNCDVDVRDHAEVVLWCKTKNINLVVVGPEDPLAKGLADHLKEAGIDCFGPCQKAAQIEASKEFAKYFMDKYEIPTARWKSFKDAKEAQDHILNAPYDALVVKASGLAAGKGVIVAKNKEEAVIAVDTLKQDKSLSSANDTIVIEELLTGEEVSVLCFSDGIHIAVMPPAQDHKRLLDGDEGPNTGGMGAYCRCPLVSVADMELIKEKILQKAIDGMREENSPYVGVLYAGLMLTRDGPKVLEFNCRFGDPETQVILPLLKSDLYVLMLACVKGKLDESRVEWDSKKHAAGVVVVSGGYPGSYPKGKPIKGPEKLVEDHFTVFFAGACSKSGSLQTSGGRVVTVVAVCDSLKEAAAEATSGAGRIHFDGAFYRKDIAKKALQKLPSKGMTYKSSGVDIESADDLVRKIKDLTKKTLRSEVCGGIGGFGGIFDFANFTDPLLISIVGSIGEKLMIAQECQKYEVIGSDLVANAVNEILCHGAEPLFFLDTYTCGKLKVEIAAEVITGIAKACKEAKCALIGGETAEMPGMYFESDFDLTSFARGAVEREKLLPQKENILDGDVAIGLLTNSLNSTGIKILKKIMSIHDYSYKSSTPFNDDCSFEEVLLSPQNIYVDTVLPLMRRGCVKAAIYINNGGLAEHIKKILPEEYKIILDGKAWAIPPVFDWIAEFSRIFKNGMIRDFNCGIDMILIVDRHISEEILADIKSSGKIASPIGVINKRNKNEPCVELLNAFENVRRSYRKAVSTDKEGKPVIHLAPDSDDYYAGSEKFNVAVFTSDKGTTLKALIEYSQSGKCFSNVQIALVVGPITNENKRKFSTAAGTTVIEVLEDYRSVTAEVLKSKDICLICLDNYPEDLPKDILEGWKRKIFNIHPSLLPAFNCSNVYEEVLNLGARITGCTVHLLEAGDFKGRILDQAAVAVETTDTIETLHKKVSRLQSFIYPGALEQFVNGRKLNNSNAHIFHAGSISSLNSEEILELNHSLQTLMHSSRRPGFTKSTELSCGIFDLKASGYTAPYLISGTDGVGTKLKIAQSCNKHDTIGIDLVAMCVNDILTHGAEPLFFLEAFNCGQIIPDTVKEVVSGIVEGCKQANCALVGAEINEIPGIYLNPKESLWDFEKYDVVGYAEGAVNKEHLLPRLNDIKSGDILIGLASSGIHSNGYSLVRKLVEAKNYRYQDAFPLDETKTLQEILLTPTKIYVKSVLPLIKKGYVKAAAHITGGGLTDNIPRVLPPYARVVLDGSKWNLPPVLQWIAMEGQLSEEEILQTFNCGLGMVLIIDKKYEGEVLECLKQKGETARVVGSVNDFETGKERVEVVNFELPKSSTLKKKKKVGVLISGSGTNLQALIDYTQNPNNCSSAEIVLVLSNVAGVEGLTRASRAGIPTKVLSHKNFKKRVDFDMAVHAILKESGVEIVCLAGFMRIVSKEFVQLWQGKLLNVHPAILPAFKGMDAHRQVLAEKAKITGCTVHFVEAEVDAGAIIQQAAVRVYPEDDEKSLQEKVKKLEHQIFPTALELLASGRISRDSNGKLVWH